MWLKLVIGLILKFIILWASFCCNLALYIYFTLENRKSKTIILDERESNKVGKKPKIIVFMRLKD